MAERGYPFTYTLRTEQVRENLIRFVRSLPIANQQVKIHEERRTDAQSDKMHAMARDLSKQVPYMGQTLSIEQWKRFATAKLKKDTIVFDCDDRGQPSAAAGLIVLGAKTRDMDKEGVSQIIEWFYWMGAQHNVIWSEPQHASPRTDAPSNPGLVSSVGETPSASVSR